MSELSDYIRDLIKKGYDINTIRANLVSYGYNPTDINQAFNEISSSSSGGQKVPTKILYIAGGVFGFIILIIIFVVVFSGGEPEQEEPVFVPKELKFQITMESDTVKPGGSVEFDLEVDSSVSQKADIRYEISDFSTGEVLIEQDDAAVFEGEETLSKKISVSDFEKGEYLLKVIIDSDSGKMQKTRRFDVDHLVVPLEGGCSINDDCEGDEACSKGECVKLRCMDDEVARDHRCIIEQEEEEEDVYNYPTGESAEPAANINDIIEVGKEDKEKAISLCNGLKNKADNEACFSRLATVTDDSNLCEKIDSELASDSCYANFALNMDFSVCDKIRDEYQRSICNAMAVSQAQNQEAAAQ